MTQPIEIGANTIPDCGLAVLRRFQRLTEDAHMGRRVLRPGPIPLMPPLTSGAKNWRAWRDTVEAWVEGSGGDDREGVLPAADAVLAEVLTIGGAL